MEHGEDFGAPPAGMNMELFGHWFEEMDNYQDKHMDPAKDMCEYFTSNPSLGVSSDC
jgi:hypothetical protein